MSSHQDYLARRRLAATLMNPSANMPSVLNARSYTEVKAFVLETACATASLTTQLRQSLITAESAAHTCSTGLAAADPSKYDLRGLPTAMVENCPPAYPMLVGTTDTLEDGTPARGNRAPAVNSACMDAATAALYSSSRASRRRWANDAYSAYSRAPSRMRQRACHDAVCLGSTTDAAAAAVVVRAVLWLDGSDASTLFQDTGGETQVTASSQIVRLWRDKLSSELAFEAVESADHMWSGGMVLCSGGAGAGMRLTASSNGAALPLANESSSVFLVLRQSNEFNVDQIAAPFVYGSGGNPRMWYIAGNSAKIGAVNQPLIESTWPPLGTVTHIVSCIEPAVGVAGWIDGWPFTSGANSTYNWESAGVAEGMDAWLFNKVINGTQNPFQGAIAEVLVLDEQLSDGARQAVEGHLAWKWDMQSALPAGHPFRTVRPPELVIE
jgi:hypothetical protein